MNGVFFFSYFVQNRLFCSGFNPISGKLMSFSFSFSDGYYYHAHYYSIKKNYYFIHFLSISSSKRKLFTTLILTIDSKFLFVQNQKNNCAYITIPLKPVKDLLKVFTLCFPFCNSIVEYTYSSFVWSFFLHCLRFFLGCCCSV